MDCEKYDRVVLDLLYEELDELTATAARRHMEHCSRCASIGSGLRATREVGQLELLEPPADLEQRILRAERQAHAELPLRERVARAVSVMAGYAMRPQLAMAALLVLVLASSLLLLRARPGDRNAMRVTERGIPEAEGEAVIVSVPDKRAASEAELALAQSPDPFRDKGGRGAGADADEGPESAKAEAAPGAGGADGTGTGTGEAYDRAMAHFNDSRFADAQRDFEEVERKGGENAASAALQAARAVLRQSGCTAAAPRFEAVASRYPGIGVAHEATWQAADCYRKLGEHERARQSYLALRSTQGYRERAQAAIDDLEAPGREPQAIASRRAKAKAARPAAPKPAAKPARKAAPGGKASAESSVDVAY